MITLASGISYLDLDFQGVPGIIATAVLQAADGVVLIDPGPSTTLPVLRRRLEEAGIGIGDVTTLLLTHIHLDHAGACGTLVAQNPRLRVLVHEAGAPHLVQPDKLIASATRLWPDSMDRLWGEIRPVPAPAIVKLAGGERLQLAGRRLEVAYTPGHAAHHVSYFEPEAGIAFVGDTAGILLMGGGSVVPPAPPPDIDLEAWRRSLAAIAEWRPDTLFITHFGPAAPVAPHLGGAADGLETMAALARTSLARPGSDEERERWFVDELRRTLRRRMSDADVSRYDAAGRFDLSWRGLARYWRKREPR